MFGPHLTIDLYGCDSKLLNDSAYIYRMLDEMPKLLDMKKIIEPQILPYAGSPGTFDKGGVSAFVLIATSHISIHTFVHQKYASIDIFSCKAFDTKKAVKYVADKFRARKTETNLFNRGREFPKEEPLAERIVAKDRKNIKALHKLHGR